MSKKNILILCTGNSCRSQMAEGYFRLFADKYAHIYSAGVAPHGVNEKTVSIMLEDGVDISNHTSNHVDEYQHIDFDFVITVCDHAQETCPTFFSSSMKVHESFPDPPKMKGEGEEIAENFRQVRDMIKTFCKDFTLKYLNR